MVDKAGKAVDAIAIGIALDGLFGLCAGEGSVETTGEDRSARAASRSVSWNRRGASA